MQENMEPQPSLSQLLRESYLEARAQQRLSEMSRSDAPPSRLQIYGSLKGKAEDSLGHSDPHFPDLSAFLSQEELDKSVNLARQAIGHEPRDERAGVRAQPEVCPGSQPSTDSVTNTSTFPAPAQTFPQLLPEYRETNTTFAPDRKMHKSSLQQDSVLRNGKDTGDTYNDFNRSTRSAPYGPETQSKKEFLNKAADFIEELSSLFKANSSKRVRPRVCKAHRSRTQNKSQADGMVHSVALDDRERTLLCPQLDKDRPAPLGPLDSDKADIQPDCRTVELDNCVVSEETLSDAVPSEETEAENIHLRESSFPTDAACEPPRFIQKLKSREVPEGSKVQLDCIVQGQPVPEVRWFCEGKELENSPDVQILTNGEHHTLIITEAFEEDTGRYSCFASNFYGTDSTSAEIYVEGASSSDSEDQHLDQAAQQQKKQKTSLPQSEESLSATEECVESKSDAPEKEVELPSAPSQPVQAEAPLSDPSPSADTKVSSITLPAQDGTSVSVIQQAQEELPLVHTSLPSNSVMSSVLSVPAPARTQPPHSEIQISNLNLMQDFNVQPAMAPPEFTKSLQDLVAAEGQLVVLECRVRGRPSPRVEWFREGNLISDSPEFRILQKKPRSPAESEEICTLVIAEVFTEDSGTFRCTASNNYGTVSSAAELKVKGNANNTHHARSSSSSVSSEPVQTQPAPVDVAAPTPSPDVSVTSSVKAHSSTLRLDPLISSSVRLDPLNTSTLRLDPQTSSMLRPDPLRSSLPAPEPPASASNTSYFSSRCNSMPNLDPLHFNQDLSTPSLPLSETQNISQRLFLKPVLSPPAVTVKESQPTISDSAAQSLNHQNGTSVVVPLPDPPPNSCLKTGTLKKHRQQRGRSRKGLRVHFKLPEDEEHSEPASLSESEENTQAAVNKEPPPLLAKPKLDPAQLQLLHNQVLLEQQQDNEPTAQTESPLKAHHPVQVQLQPELQNQEGPVWSPRLHREPPFQPYVSTVIPPAQTQPPLTQFITTTVTSTAFVNTAAPPRPAPMSAPQLTSTVPTMTAPTINTTFPPPVITAPSLSSGPSAPVLKPSAPMMMSPPPPSAPSITVPIFISPPPSSAPSVPLPVMMSSPPSSAPSVPVPVMMSPSPSSAPSAPILKPSAPAMMSPSLSLPPSASNLKPSVPVMMSPPQSSAPSAPVLRPSASVMMSPPPAPQLSTLAPSLSAAPVTQMNTIHASHLNLSAAALGRDLPTSQFFSPSAPKLSAVPAAPTPILQQITSPAALLRSTHASLMNLSASSQTFSYTRPKEFIAAQSFSPVRSPSPTESPVPLLQELAAEFSSSATSSPTIPPFSPPPRFFPTRVLQSPTSPPSSLSSPTLSSMLLNTMFGLRAQSPPQAASPTSSSSTPSPIQNPVAFLSSVLPSLSTAKATNEMGLPKRAPTGPLKKTPIKARVPSLEEIRESKECLLSDIEKKLRLRDEPPQYQYQQKPSFEGKTASRPLGPNNAATVINYEEEYKISNFEQRLMSEIEFRLERTPVEESDDEVQHEDVPTGKCIAPIFDKKLKNFRAMEGVPVTFSCKLVGVPVPKVYWFKDGKQILRKNTHYRKIREGDGTCALHIEAVTNDDDGNFTIMAANPQGRISCSGHLIIQTGPSRNRQTPMQAQRVRARIQEVESEQTQERFFQPCFLQAPGDMMAHEGKLCRLDCKVSGLPNPELMWLVNGRPIYPDLYHKMLVRENGVHSLVIEPVTKKDAGNYTCIASNKAGQSSFSLELSVVEKEMKHPPQFVEKLQNVGIPEGTPVRLECRVVGMPPPLIFWKKDNETIPRTKDRFSMHQDASGYLCLLIQPTTKEDAGWYTASAKNEAGIVSCTCRLDIYAQWHQSVPAPVKKAPRSGSRYAALTGQGLDIKSAFCAPEAILFASSPPENTMESDEL